MERLTFEGNFCDIAMCRENPCPYNGSCSQREVWERLKAYEDTGLAPNTIKAIFGTFSESDRAKLEELRVLLRAKREGRLVVLPCKPGDTVFTRNHHGRIVDGVVQSIHQNCVGGKAGRWVATVYYPEYNGIAESCLNPDFLPERKMYGLEHFGEIVFLTREEAEAALANVADINVGNKREGGA